MLLHKIYFFNRNQFKFYFAYCQLNTVVFINILFGANFGVSNLRMLMMTIFRHDIFSNSKFLYLRIFWAINIKVPQRQEEFMRWEDFKVQFISWVAIYHFCRKYKRVNFFFFAWKRKIWEKENIQNKIFLETFFQKFSSWEEFIIGVLFIFSFNHKKSSSQIRWN